MGILEKIDRITNIGDRITKGCEQPAPKSVKIEVTSKCNLRCKFCALRTRLVQTNKDMDFDFFKKITEDMRNSGVEEIGLFYLGESFMSPELLIKCTRWVKRELEFPWVFLTSNAVNADHKYVYDVMLSGLDSLKWSVNYDSYNTFHSITGGNKNQFNKALANIKNAYIIRKAHNLKTILSASSILYNYDAKDKMAGFLAANIKDFVDQHYWLPLYQMSMYKNEVEKNIGYTPTAGNMGRIDEETMLPNRKSLPCWSAFTEGHVRVDGNVSACCFGADDRFDMGKLDGSNFMKIWNSSKFKKLREAQLKTLDDGPKALKETPCKVCVAWDEPISKQSPRYDEWAGSLLA
jgi:MoaA/NifB/PqqE/SkfB family radical SAM enzyme